MSSLTILLFVLAIRSLLSLEEDYYWRQYTGTIPPDAIVGGHDINRKNIFIGQVYMEGQGLIVVEIFPGLPDVYAPVGGKSHKIDSHIKILCGAQENFSWSSGNSTHLHLQLINKKPIIGGHETGGYLFVGRISYEGGSKIGKVIAFNTGIAMLHYNHKGAERGIGSYEILLFNGNSDNGVDVRL